jgi:hypothetical protein
MPGPPSFRFATIPYNAHNLGLMQATQAQADTVLGFPESEDEVVQAGNFRPRPNKALGLAAHFAKIEIEDDGHNRIGMPLWCRRSDIDIDSLPGVSLPPGAQALEHRPDDWGPPGLEMDTLHASDVSRVK